LGAPLADLGHTKIAFISGLPMFRSWWAAWPSSA
jgi:hypothetical protein